MDLVTRICRLPLEFKTRGNVSVIQLLDEFGYQASPTSLTVDAVSAVLRQSPELTDAWLGYSEDKRTSSGWYVMQREADSFEIGYHPGSERIVVRGRESACAEFIVREVRSIAG
jgi:hypothetical protein